MPERLDVKAVLGDCKLDLRQAEVPPEVTIEVKVRLGDVTIYVPADARVELTGRSILGDKKVRGEPGAAAAAPSSAYTPTSSSATSRSTLRPQASAS